MPAPSDSIHPSARREVGKKKSLDMPYINKLGASPLVPHMRSISSVSTLDDLIGTIASLQLLDVSIYRAFRPATTI